MSLSRFFDWQLRWDAFVRSRAAQPFAWGVNDCALWAADAVESLTGAHLCPELRGHSDVRSALRAMRRAGGLEAIARRALGEPVAPGLARVGDVVLLQIGRRRWLGICNGQTFLAPGERGVEAGPMSLASLAWRVG